VHCIGGIIGALLTGVFVSKDISGVEGSLLTQCWGVGATLIYGFIVSFVILKIIDVTIGLRVTEEQEREGLDISLHGERVE
jgi:Amt family ammonium transporter